MGFFFVLPFFSLPWASILSGMSLPLASVDISVPFAFMPPIASSALFHAFIFHRSRLVFHFVSHPSRKRDGTDPKQKHDSYARSALRAS